MMQEAQTRGRRCDLKPTNGSYSDGDSNNRCALFSVAIRKPLIRQVKPQKRNKDEIKNRQPGLRGQAARRPPRPCAKSPTRANPPYVRLCLLRSNASAKKGPASPCQAINGSGGVASALSKSGATLSGATAISTGMSSPSPSL